MTNDTVLIPSHQDDPEFQKAFHIFYTWYGKFYISILFCFVLTFQFCGILASTFDIPFDKQNASILVYVCFVASLLGIREFIPPIWYMFYTALKPVDYEAIRIKEEAEYKQHVKDISKEYEQKAIQHELHALRQYHKQSEEAKLKVKTAPLFKPNMSPQRVQTRSDNSGYVYLLAALHDPTLFKIGRTNNPANRMRTFEVKLPFAIEYTCTIKTDDMYQLERELHTKYRSKRLEGEWFKLSSEDVEYIKGLAHANT